MSAGNKVIWSEGMFLRPQHFQQQDRYLERYVDGRLSAQNAYNWGVSEIAVDSEPLAMGKISITFIKCVFPDGTPLLAPDSDNPPAVLEVPENIQDEIVYLCIPLQRHGSQDSIRDEEDFPQARFQTHNYDVRNNAAQASDAARIQIGKLRACLKLQSEDLSGYASIGIARIVERLADKPVKLDRSFIPALTNIDASAELKAYLEEVKGLLKQRGDALGHRLADSGRAGSAEIADYLLLQVINRVEPMLLHLNSLTHLHPLTLFTELIQLAGELATFTSSSKRPPVVPNYSHQNLQQCFAGLFSSLRHSLSMVLEQSAVAMPLVERKYGIHVAPITDPSMMSSCAFVLATKADVQTDLLRNRFPSQAKIAPVETIRELITTQLPGLKIRPLPVAPRQIPYHAGFTYFEIETSGDLWSAMKQSGGFAVHLGAEFPGLVMELWAIRS